MSQNKLTLSIIVPVYNVELYIDKCLDSILSQTFKDFELILIDDGSTDRSGFICDKYAARDHRVHVIHKKNEGVSAARNLGIRFAKGTWIAFVDADDWLEPEMYASMLSISEEEDSDIVYCNFYAINKSEIIPVSQPKHNGDNIALVKSYIMRGWTVVWNLIIKRKFIESNKLYFDINLSYGEDFVFLMKAFISSHRISQIEKPFYNYNRINDNSALSNKHFDYYKQVISSIVSVIDFASLQTQDNELDKLLGWKIIRAKQDLVLYPDMHNEFLNLYSQYHKYIHSCPWIGRKMKILMWLLTNHLGIFVKVFDYLRFIRIGSSKKY